MGETPEGRNLFTQNGFHVNTWNRFIEGKKNWGMTGGLSKRWRKTIFLKAEHADSM